MKHPVRTIVINLVLAVLLVGLLIAATQIEALNDGELMIAGISFGSGNGAFLVSDSSSYEKESEGEVKASEINSLDIAWQNGAIKVVLTDGDTIRFYEESDSELEDKQIMRWKQDGKKLTIRFGTKGGIFREDPDKTLTVEIPAADWAAQKVAIQTVSASCELEAIVTTDFSFDGVSGGFTANSIDAETVNLNTVSGALQIGMLECDTFSADSVSGGITIGAATVSDELTASTVSGELDFSGSAQKVEWDSTSGSAELTFVKAPSSVEIDTTSGDATLILPEEIGGFSVEIDSLSGELTSDFDLHYSDGRAYYGDSSIEIEMDSTSGDLEIRQS